MHRAEQIIEALQSILRARLPSSINVYAHRMLSLGQEAGELPAVTIDFGEDVATESPGSEDLEGTIGSLLTVNITAVVQDADEQELRRRLLDIRANVHEAVKFIDDLGLPFVTDTHYGGALPPEIGTDSDELVGELTSIWGVRYEMHLLTAE